MGKKGIGDSFFDKNNFHKQDKDSLTIYHIHEFPDWLKDLVNNGSEEKVDGRQKKEILTNIVAYLVSNNILTQKQIAEITKCSAARISQIMKPVKEQEKNKSTTF